jgi:hypothetical protein
VCKTQLAKQISRIITSLTLFLEVFAPIAKSKSLWSIKNELAKQNYQESLTLFLDVFTLIAKKSLKSTTTYLYSGAHLVRCALTRYSAYHVEVLNSQPKPFYFFLTSFRLARCCLPSYYA